MRDGGAICAAVLICPTRNDLRRQENYGIVIITAGRSLVMVCVAVLREKRGESWWRRRKA